MLRHGKERLWLWEDDQGFVQVSQILEQNAFSHGGFTEKDLRNTVLSSKSYKGFQFQWQEGDENFGPGIKALKPCDQWNHWEGERTAGGLPLNHCSANQGNPKPRPRKRMRESRKRAASVLLTSTTSVSVLRLVASYMSGMRRRRLTAAMQTPRRSAAIVVKKATVLGSARSRRSAGVVEQRITTMLNAPIWTRSVEHAARSDTWRACVIPRVSPVAREAICGKVDPILPTDRSRSRSQENQAETVFTRRGTKCYRAR